jgi:hypothetical protein
MTRGASGDPRYVVALTLASLTAFGGPTSYVDAWMNSANYRNDRIFRLYVALCGSTIFPLTRSGT